MRLGEDAKEEFGFPKKINGEGKPALVWVEKEQSLQEGIEYRIFM